MKIFKYLTLVLVVVLAVSCEKHEIDYNTTPLDESMAEFQLHYVNPVSAVTANYITRITINDVALFDTNYTKLTTYSALPGSIDYVGRFYVCEAGTVNLKLYQGTGSSHTLVYDQDVTLSAGKQNVFVHDFSVPPVVFDNGYPYVTNITEDTDTVTYVKFYNFLYESAGVPCDLRLQYQYIDPFHTNDTLNIGEPVAFGETTGWQQVKIKKSEYNSSGYCRIDYFIKVIDSDGNVVGPLTARNTSGTTKEYSDYWTGYIGRRVHHIFCGNRTASPGSAVRQWWALY